MHILCVLLDFRLEARRIGAHDAIHFIAVKDKNESGESGDTILSRDFSMLISVNAKENDTLVLQAQFIKNRVHHLARTAPTVNSPS